jgi:hypothetical protein
MDDVANEEDDSNPMEVIQMEEETPAWIRYQPSLFNNSLKSNRSSSNATRKKLAKLTSEDSSETEQRLLAAVKPSSNKFSSQASASTTITSNSAPFTSISSNESSSNKRKLEIVVEDVEINETVDSPLFDSLIHANDSVSKDENAPNEKRKKISRTNVNEASALFSISKLDS